MSKLKLPKICYGPLCNKILKDFIDYHKLDHSLELPKEKDEPIIILEKIFNIILYSLCKEKIDEILDDSKKYYSSIPPSVRR